MNSEKVSKMEIPIQIAVRIRSNGSSTKENVVKSILPPEYEDFSLKLPQRTPIIQVKSEHFSVAHALQQGCSQDQIYHQTVYPLIGMFLEGFDASFVTYGQKNTGKTYTMIGPGFDCVHGESEQGIVQRCVRDIFMQLSQQRERYCVVNIGWVEVIDDEIHDLLDNSGNVPCLSVEDVFHWLRIGMGNRSHGQMHSIFTLTLEQRWEIEGLIQHRLSTASFCDLCSTNRRCTMNSVAKEEVEHEQFINRRDIGLQALEQIVSVLANPSVHFNINHGMIPYNQTTLTTLLKDSFGGRAQTLLIMCVSPLEDDISETLENMHFALQAQRVRNFVVLNTYSDNNTLLMNVVDNIVPEERHPDNLNLQFAASQWLKLVSNAEGLFSKLISNKTINEQDRERIEEWMFLKQECEECLSSGELNIIGTDRHLGPIQEADEPDETYSDQETSCQQNSDNESDSDSHHSDLEEKIVGVMDDFRIKTDAVIKEKYDDFVRSHPKAVLDSNDRFSPVVPSNADERRLSSPRGRRKSIQPGSLSLSSIEIAMLNRRVASREQTKNLTAQDKYLDSSSTDVVRPTVAEETIQNELQKVDTDLEAAQRQIKELENIIVEKKKLITSLIQSSDTSSIAKQRFNKKKSKLKAEYEKTKKQLTKAVENGKDKHEIERLKQLTAHITQRLQDSVMIKHIAGESGPKVKQHQESLQVSHFIF